MQNGRFGGIGLSAKKFEIDMSTGSLVKSIIAFVIPLMLSNILQLSLQCGGYYCRGTISREGGIGGGRLDRTAD